jgi:UDP-N-acetylmuramoylalanine--D-glutamate ligase
MEGRIKALVLIGESAPEFEELFRAFPQARAGSLDDAVVKAMKASGKGDVILLSPACASFDMFRNYEERGDMFRLSLRKLREGVLSWT